MSQQNLFQQYQSQSDDKSDVSRSITKWNRKSVVIQVKQEHRLELLRIANLLTESGLHVETMLGSRAVIFGSFPSEIDPGKILANFAEVTSWEED